jgi:hypothetical protein
MTILLPIRDPLPPRLGTDVGYIRLHLVMDVLTVRSPVMSSDRNPQAVCVGSGYRLTRPPLPEVRKTAEQYFMLCAGLFRGQGLIATVCIYDAVRAHQV